MVFNTQWAMRMIKLGSPRINVEPDHSPHHHPRVAVPTARLASYARARRRRHALDRRHRARLRLPVLVGGALLALGATVAVPLLLALTRGTVDLPPAIGPLGLGAVVVFTLTTFCVCARGAVAAAADLRQRRRA